MKKLRIVLLTFLVPMGSIGIFCAENIETAHTTGTFNEEIPPHEIHDENDLTKKYREFIAKLKLEKESSKDTQIIDDIIKLTEEMLELSNQQVLMHKATKEFSAAAEKMSTNTHKIFLNINDTLVDYYNAEHRRAEALALLQGGNASPALKEDRPKAQEQDDQKNARRKKRSTQ